MSVREVDLANPGGAVFLPPGIDGNVPHFDVRFDTGDEGRGLVYLPSLPENGQAFCSLARCSYVLAAPTQSLPALLPDRFSPMPQFVYHLSRV